MVCGGHVASGGADDDCETADAGVVTSTGMIVIMLTLTTKVLMLSPTCSTVRVTAGAAAATAAAHSEAFSFVGCCRRCWRLREVMLELVPGDGCNDGEDEDGRC